MIVFTFEFGHDITILKMAIFNKVDYIEIEAALIQYDGLFDLPVRP